MDHLVILTLSVLRRHLRKDPDLMIKANVQNKTCRAEQSKEVLSRMEAFFFCHLPVLDATLTFWTNLLILVKNFYDSCRSFCYYFAST